MRWDSPFVLAVAGTLAIHTIFITATDAVEQYTRNTVEPAPHIELVDVELPVPPPPPPPPPLKQAEPPPPPKDIPAKVVPKQQIARPQPQRQEQPPPPDPTPPPPNPDPNPTGGDDPPQIDAPPSGRGYAKRGAPRDHNGMRGTGGGTGGGAGSGTATIPEPTSVATIKTPAMPKGDYEYFKAGKDYPTEARQLGIHGEILVRMVVDAHGKVVSTRLVKGLGHGLDELALQRANTIMFDPAIDTNGQPVTSVIVWKFKMQIPE